MGVRGLTSFLKRKGFPSDDDVQIIPEGSTLAFDGNGLAFDLFRRAYLRHFHALARDYREKPQQHRHGEVEHVLIAKLLPCMLPLQCLVEETRQYLRRLTDVFGMKVSLYFDGKMRRYLPFEEEEEEKEEEESLPPHLHFKYHTQAERSKQRSEKRMNLQQYCQFGILAQPNIADKEHLLVLDSGIRVSAESMLSNFPLPELLVTQVRITALELDGIKVIQCQEEADRDVAMASILDPTGGTYTIGLDTDYMMFGKPAADQVKYVPLDSLHLTGCVLSGCVVRRDELAAALGLPDDAAVIEMSILMGNDYTKHFVESKESRKELGYDGKCDPESVVSYLIEMGEGYRVSSVSVEFGQTARYVRLLYGFDDMDEFPLIEDEESSLLSLFPDFDVNLALMRYSDSSILDTVLRVLGSCLELQVENENTEAKCTSAERNGENEASSEEDEDCSVVKDAAKEFSHLHLSALKETAEVISKRSQGNMSQVDHRPTWNNIVISGLIEKIFRTSIEMSSRSDVLPFSVMSPANFFDPWVFHRILHYLDADSTPIHAPSVPRSHSLASLDASVLEHSAQEEVSSQQALPIDEHERTILETISSQSVTIVQGETGCGKSSRIPVMILKAPSPDPKRPVVRMFVCQPRRIAAKTLLERVRSSEPDLRDCFGLRLGHGVREYDSPKTRVWFVTTGYLVRLLANYPKAFDKYTHLLIDEVHERGVDSDLICLFARRLLDTHPSIRIVLMSATMAADIYQDYFHVTRSPIHVGAKRFPIKEYYVEDLQKAFRLPESDAKMAKDIWKACEKCRAKQMLPGSALKLQHKLAVKLTMIVARPGSAVLIFVPGMNDIIDITEMAEKNTVAGLKFRVYPIHGDIPFDEQLAAFEKPENHEIKVIVATNAAESSVTLPDVDHVICLGLCKQIVYNPSSHRQVLCPCWISRASATQRAGRTGRVREGNVYRLYSRQMFECHMSPFESGEMTRIPVDSVILTFKDMVSEEVIPMLKECIEPPDMDNIARSFESLHSQGFLTSPDDFGAITSQGSLVMSLGLDLHLGRLVGLGIQFGVAAEAIEVAAISSFPKSPWRMTHSLWSEVTDFNEITVNTFRSKNYFDSNLYSDTLGIMNMLWEFDRAKIQWEFCMKHQLALPRIKQLKGVIKNLRFRVATYFGIQPDRLCLIEPPARMPRAKITIIRLIQVWVFNDNIIQGNSSWNSPRKGEIDVVDVSLQSQFPLTDRHLARLLGKNPPPFFLRSTPVIYSGTFEAITQDDDTNPNDSLKEFDSYFLSYALEKDFEVACYSLPVDTSNRSFFIFLRVDLVDSLKLHAGDGEQVVITLVKRKDFVGRGKRGRPCGFWSKCDLPSSRTSREDNALVFHDFLQFQFHEESKWKVMMNDAIKACSRIFSKAITCSVVNAANGHNKKTFHIVTYGDNSEISRQELIDLFCTPELKVSQTRKNGPQTVSFKIDSSGTKPCAMMDNSHERLFVDLPLGARLLSVLASERRTGTVCVAHGDDEMLEFKVDKNLLVIHRWHRLDYKFNRVFVASNSIPAAAFPVNNGEEIFACCANGLEINGGGLRVDFLTILPLGRNFLELALLAFGIQSPFEKVLQESAKADFSDCDNLNNDRGDELSKKHQAVAFHNSCLNLGEEVWCYPFKVCELLKIFDQEPWDGLQDNPFIPGCSLRIERGAGTPEKRVRRMGSGERKSDKGSGALSKSHGHDNRFQEGSSKLTSPLAAAPTPAASKEISSHEQNAVLSTDGSAPRIESCAGIPTSHVCQLGCGATKSEEGDFAPSKSQHVHEKVVPGEGTSNLSSSLSASPATVAPVEIGSQGQKDLPCTVKIVRKKMSLLDHLSRLFDTTEGCDLSSTITLKSEERTPIRVLALIVLDHNKKLLERIENLSREAKEVIAEKCQFDISHCKLYEALLGSEIFYFSTSSIDAFIGMVSLASGSTVPLKRRSTSMRFPVQLCDGNTEARDVIVRHDHLRFRATVFPTPELALQSCSCSMLSNLFGEDFARFKIGSLCEMSWDLYNFSLRIPDLFTIERYRHAGFLDFPATNILSVVVNHIQNEAVHAEEGCKETRPLCMEDFEIFSLDCIEDEAERWYVAFLKSTFILQRVKASKPIVRPCTWRGACLCVPPVFSELVHREQVLEIHGTRRRVVMLQRPELALNFEAAFCLEALFGEGGRHWYRQTMDQMIQKLQVLN